MVTEARPVLPTDLLALVSYKGRRYQNEAWTRERMGASEPPGTLGLVLDSFLAFAKGRSAWINVKHQRLQGLVGARRRGGRQAWEIDYLIDATPGGDVVPGLLECAIADAGRGGAEKLFLRLESDSQLLPIVRETGFLPYQEEVLYSRSFGLRANADTTLRPVTPSDSYLLFRLYNQLTPETARRSEAATFGEWHAAQETRWLKNGLQRIGWEHGEPTASVRAARLPQGVLMELMLTEKALDQTRAIIAAAVHDLEAGQPSIFVLLPRSAGALASRLEDAGFEPQQEFVSLMRRTTRTQTLPLILPAVAGNAVPGV